jgi:hypothetical protein
MPANARHLRALRHACSVRARPHPVPPHPFVLVPRQRRRQPGCRRGGSASLLTCCAKGRSRRSWPRRSTQTCHALLPRHLHHKCRWLLAGAGIHVAKWHSDCIRLAEPGLSLATAIAALSLLQRWEVSLDTIATSDTGGGAATAEARAYPNRDLPGQNWPPPFDEVHRSRSPSSSSAKG